MVNLCNFLAGIGQVRQGNARSGLARFGVLVRGSAWRDRVVHGWVRRGSAGQGAALAWLLCGGLQAADIKLTVDPPLSPVSEHRIYYGPSAHAYSGYQTFPATNTFNLIVTNTGRIYLAASALNGSTESDLSGEIVVRVFPGWVQLSSSTNGWTNYMQIFVPVQVVEPQRFVRVKLEIQ